MEEQILDIIRERDELKHIIDTLEDSFIETDIRGAVTRFNRAFCELCGYPPEDADGLSYRTYMDEANARKVYSTFNAVYKSGVPNKAFDYEIIRKDGERRNVEISIAALRDKELKISGFRCIMRDVTRRKKAEKEIVRQRNSLAAIFESVDDAIVTIDTDQTIIEINEATQKICSVPQSFKGSGFFSSEPAECSRSCRKVIEEILTTRKPVRNYPVSCRRILNPMQQVSISCTPLEDHQDIFLGVVIVIRDFTHLIDLETTLGKRSGFHQMIGKSREMQVVYRLIEDIADYDATVLITGESGTGKELVARAIHHTGNRNFRPFVSVNCSALAESLLESELFGHVKGAFTGAVRDHIGRFQAADGGTILLDEIGDISPVIQLKLLRVLQEKTLERVGDSRSVRVDVRVIACTHQDLKQKVKCGEFREDLFYRLKVLEISLPSLRERIEDLPLLIDHFLSLFSDRFKLTSEGLSEAVMQIFMNYSWPGNIRELEHAVERALILSKGKLITPDHIPQEILCELKYFSTRSSANDEFESQNIEKALQKAGWNKSKASRMLGISRKTLYQKIRKYRIQMPAG